MSEKSNKKVLLIGPGGGRESALAWKFEQDGNKVFVTNPNGGFNEEQIAKDETGKAIDQFDFENLSKFAQEESIDLAVVSGDDALAADITTKLKESGIKKVFGPSAKAAQLESSKAFAKEIMSAGSVPTAAYKNFTDYDAAEKYIQEQFAKGASGIVVKASGLAQGKGVTVADSFDEAKQALKKCLVDSAFGESGAEVVIEEKLRGKEFSSHALADSKGNTVIFPLVADYKPAFDKDQGDNTGGMGVYGFLQKGNEEFLSRLKTSVVDPVIQEMIKREMPFVGLLYPGLMQDGDQQPNIIEYNARFGDPEAQVFMRLLADDCKLYDLLCACIEGELSADKVKWRKDTYGISITLASAGYPGKYEKGKEISGIEDAENIENVKVFHAGTKLVEGKLVTSGGRVLHVTATADSLEKARAKAYQAVEKISFEGKQFRTDIGQAGTREEIPTSV